VLVPEIYKGQRPTLYWMCPLKVVRHMLQNPVLRNGNFAYHPEFTEDFSTIEFHHTIYYHLAQLECGPNSTVVVIYSNTDGTMTTARGESHLFYIRTANTKSPACFDQSCVQLIAALPTLSTDDSKYNSAEDRMRAQIQLFHDCIDKMFADFNVVSQEWVPKP
jgi:hypothetical protein